MCLYYFLAGLVVIGFAAMPQADETTLRVLVFSKTAGYRHESIAAGIATLERLEQERNWRVTASEDAAIFSDEGLREFDVVVFLNTSGDVLDEMQQAAFERYIQQGGGFVGVHAASDTEYDWAWYGGLVGAYFAGHPPGTMTAVVRVADNTHPAARMLPETWQRVDEWYNFARVPAADVILSLDESSYSGGTMGENHPIAWSQLYDGGRSFYTGLGHTVESYSEPLFVEHLAAGIEWAGKKQ